MTEALAPADPYVTSFEAAVEAIDGHDVVLDRTYFYAESGGQPPDRGVLDGVEVVDVQHDGDAVVHTLGDEPSFAAGEVVAGQVDEAFRRYCMRAHSASHVLYGAGRRLLDDLGYGGFDISERKVRVDFTTPTTIDDGVLLQLERLTNRAVWESRPVTWAVHPTATALEMDHIAFNTKTEEGIADDEVRVVTVGGLGDEDDPWDVAACGGTHVSNTREIGPVTVLGRSNPGSGLTRVEFAVGPTAIRRRIEEKRAAFEAAGALDASVDDLPAAVDRLAATVAGLEAERDELRDQLAKHRLEALRDETVERDGSTWVVGRVDGLDPNALADRAGDLVGDGVDVVALVGGDDRPFIAAAAGEGVDAAAVVEEVTERFGGGGGGTADAAQGGGLEADPDEVVAFLR